MCAEDELKERRKFLRYNGCLNVNFLNPPINNHAFTCDLSLKGLGVFVHHQLSAQKLVELCIFHPFENNKSIYIKGKVVWLRQMYFYIYRVGIEIQEVNEKDLNALLELYQ